VGAKVEALVATNRALEKEVERLRAKLASGGGGRDLAGSAVDVEGLKVLAARLEGVDAKSLRAAVDQLKQALGDAVVLLAVEEEGKVSLVAGVSGAAAHRLKAGDLVAELAPLVGGKGGGRPDMAQGGGPDVAGLPALLAALPEAVRRRLGA
jgi:alanyl-tRNA synthetase